MRFEASKIEGAWIIHLERLPDVRGFFARGWCQREFEKHGLDPRLVQFNICHNLVKGTLRGFHAQRAPSGEAKLVRCTRGSAWDVIVDLRPDSPTFLQYEGNAITESNDCMVYLPPGVFHGFITLEDNTDVMSQVSEFYAPESTVGYRYDDPAFGIVWPIPATVISPQDQAWPDFDVELQPASSSATPRNKGQSSTY